MIEVTSEEELLKILSVISEEAVHLSKKNLNEAGDPYANEYKAQYSEDESMFGTLSEQEDEEEFDDEEYSFDDEEPAGEDEEELDVEDEEDTAADDEDEAESEEATDFGVSFDSVLSAINNLRAGKSLKDSSIKDQASAYYDRLDDAERKVLLVFLQQFSEILSGALQGSEADDPSDAPYNITMSVGGEEDEETDLEGEEDEETPEEVYTDEEGESFEEPESLEEPEELEPTEEEDTSPPIRVDESQDLIKIRRKIRRMMLRG